MSISVSGRTMKNVRATKRHFHKLKTEYFSYPRNKKRARAETMEDILLKQVVLSFRQFFFVQKLHVYLSDTRNGEWGALCVTKIKINIRITCETFRRSCICEFDAYVAFFLNYYCDNFYFKKYALVFYLYMIVIIVYFYIQIFYYGSLVLHVRKLMM